LCLEAEPLPLVGGTRKKKLKDSIKLFVQEAIFGTLNPPWFIFVSNCVEMPWLVKVLDASASRVCDAHGAWGMPPASPLNAITWSFDSKLSQI
jgi:hypothetical protein